MRAQLGAHFTGRADIEDVVDNVIMLPLRREWTETRTIIESLLTTGKKGRDGSPSRPPTAVGYFWRFRLCIGIFFCPLRMTMR
jgi:hypothetical protein